MKIKKRLIYYLWAPNEHTEFMDKIYNLHFSLLEYYRQEFTDVIFFIATDEEPDKERIEYMRKRIFDIPWDIDTNITINVIKNDPFYCESRVYYDEIVCKLEQLDGITFFAHSKSLTSEAMGYDLASKWITALYYSSFNEKDYEYKVGFKNFAVYLSLMVTSNSYYGRYFNSCGTFMWLNTHEIARYIKKTNQTIPPLGDRYYSEKFVMDIYPFTYDLICSYKNYYTKFADYHQIETDDLNSIIYYSICNKNEEEYNDFLKFYENIKNGC